MSEKLKEIPLNKIRENPVALRSVDKMSEQYQGLVESIRRNGVLQPILVREIKDPETGEHVYGLIDGLQRFSGSQDAGKDTIPAKITAMEEAEVLEAQIITNLHRIETKPIEYSKQLQQILSRNPLLTIGQLSERLSRSPQWLQERLNLTKLPDDIQELVNEGKINLSNAYALAKLAVQSPDEARNLIDRAMTATPQEFVAACTKRTNELKESKRKGRDATPAVFTPTPHLRKLSELKEEMNSGVVAKVLCRELKITNPVEAFKMALQWVFHMDPASQAEQVRADEERKRVNQQAKEERAKERLLAKTQDAAHKLAEVQEKARAAGVEVPVGT